MSPFPLILVALAAFQATPEEALQTAIAVIEHQNESITSWELEYSSECPAISPLVGQSHGPSQRMNNRELRRGEQYRRSQEVQTGDERRGSTSHDLRSFNGKVYRSLSLDEPSGMTNSKRTYDSGFTDYAYSLTRPLTEHLREVAARGRAAWDSVAGHRVLRCELDLPTGGLQTHYLDPAEGWQPRRVTIESDVPRGTYADGRIREIMLNETQEFRRQDDVILPAKIRRRVIGVSPEGREFLHVEIRFTLTKLVINPEIADSEFTIEFPEGTRVRDFDRRVRYTVGVPGSEEPLRRASTPPLPGPVPTAAGTEWTWWGDARTWLILAAASVVCLSGVIWRRRRA